MCALLLWPTGCSRTSDDAAGRRWMLRAELEHAGRALATTFVAEPGPRHWPEPAKRNRLSVPPPRSHP